MYAMENDTLLTGLFSFRQFCKLVSERKGCDADRHSDTVYRWYRDDDALIRDRPTRVLINRGEHYLSTIEEA